MFFWLEEYGQTSPNKKEITKPLTGNKHLSLLYFWARESYTVKLWVETCPNLSTTPLRQWGFWQCLPFSWTTLRLPACHAIAVMWVNCRYLWAMVMGLELKLIKKWLLEGTSTIWEPYWFYYCLLQLKIERLFTLVLSSVDLVTLVKS